MSGKKSKPCIQNLTRENIENILTALEEGYSVKSVSKKYGVSSYYINRMLMEEKILISPECLETKSGNSENTENTESSESADNNSDGSSEDIEQDLGALASRIQNIKLRRKKSSCKDKLTPETIQKVKEALKKDYSIYYVAHITGISWYYVKKISKDELKMPE